ncbi:hypothetical protein BJF90_35080 [Pseudonocardia sp. CNS-004]|nr:hypothetical protein BJF90_35080 [Pseudonocardia sp. CNS-004]
MFALDPATGTTLWRHPIPLGDETVRQNDEADPKVAHTDGRLHMRIRDTLTTFDAATGTVQWEVWLPGLGGGVDAHEDVLVQVLPDRVVSFDAASGAHRWTKPISYDGYHAHIDTGAPSFTTASCS